MYEAGRDMYKEGILKQKFKINLDYDRLNEFIADKILKSIKDDVNNPELWIDNACSAVSLQGTYTTNYRSVWYEATRECPTEYQIDRDFLSDTKENKWLLHYLPDEIKGLIDVVDIVEDEEDIEEV